MKRPATPKEQQQRAGAFFFMRVEGTARKRSSRRCEHTAPLFPLWLILDADGTLAAELAPLVEQTQA